MTICDGGVSIELTETTEGGGFTVLHGNIRGISLAPAKTVGVIAAGETDDVHLIAGSVAAKKSQFNYGERGIVVVT